MVTTATNNNRQTDKCEYGKEEREREKERGQCNISI